jgi:tRNA U34 5-methylaminomethyl-2-thiouridine-forming methyltransferase MnmC
MSMESRLATAERVFHSTYAVAGIVDFAVGVIAHRMSSPVDEFEIVTVASGARSLRSREHGETFHPVVGPMAEARTLHVEQQRLVERAAATRGDFVVWDVGLGAAANAVAVLEAFAAAKEGAAIELHSFDTTVAPLAFAVENAAELGYLAAHRATVARLLETGLAEERRVRWRLHLGDFRTLAAVAPAPHAILYDPYSPRSNPELWTLEHFTRLAALLDPQRACLWSNYTRSTAVRVTLLLAGFFVGRGAATGEKEETTLAGNDPALLVAPLDRGWLERVRRSTASAPLRAGEAAGPIAATDWQRLIAHPQFAA